MWAALLDKGYKGLHKYGRFLTPKKKTAHHDLNSDDKKKNNKIENDRVIVENSFGRMKTIWGATKLTFCFQDNLYAPYFKMCVSLTNYHIGILPLCKEDCITKYNYYKPMTDKYWQAEAKRKANVQAQYKTRRARKKLVSNVLDKDNKNFEIPEAANDTTTNQDHEE